jgi:uncharacterized protein (DUF1697 family)
MMGRHEMTTYIALLRAVNVAGHQILTMSVLREFIGQAGFSDVRTVLQSGNAIFRGKAASSDVVESKLEREAVKQLGLDTDFIVRTAKEWTEMIDRNPFPREAAVDPGHLVVSFLKKAPTERVLPELRTAIVGKERIELLGKNLFVVYPDGIGRSKLTTALIDRKLGTRGTGRNWNTVQRIQALVD